MESRDKNIEYTPVTIQGESNDSFHQDIGSIEELQLEYKESMDASDFMKIMKKKNYTLRKLLGEQLQGQLKTLEREKKHFESSQLQQSIQIPTPPTKEVIDIDTVEE